MKILLINPPSSYESFIPPPGLSYLSAVLKKAGHRVYGFDAASPMRKLSLADIENKVDKIMPDVIGVTLNLYFIRGGYELSRRLRKKNMLLVAGGPHARACPEEVLNHNYDIVVNGEAEITFLEIIDYIAGKKPLSNILGIFYKDENNQVRKNPERPLISNLDELPFMDRYLFPINNYTKKDLEMLFGIRFSRVVAALMAVYIAVCPLVTFASGPLRMSAVKSKCCNESLKRRRFHSGMMSLLLTEDGFSIF